MASALSRAGFLASPRSQLETNIPVPSPKKALLLAGVRPSACHAAQSRPLQPQCTAQAVACTCHPTLQEKMVLARPLSPAGSRVSLKSLRAINITVLSRMTGPLPVGVRCTGVATVRAWQGWKLNHMHDTNCLRTFMCRVQ